MEGTILRSEPLARSPSEGWWSRQESNLRPSHCERDALPTELRPHSTNVRAVLFFHRSADRATKIRAANQSPATGVMPKCASGRARRAEQHKKRTPRCLE